MRIAFSGTHRAGKSTLLEAVAAQVPGYRVVDEPYHQLEEEGYELADPPSVEDFTQQLRFSIVSIVEGSADVLFDRCPLDFVAYLQAIDDLEGAGTLDERVRQVLRAMTRG
jgi:predicted ATPase